MRVRWGWAVGLMAWAALAGCSGGGRVNEQLANPTELRNAKQAIVLIRFPPPDPGCHTLGLQLGVREGTFYRPVQTLRLQQVAVTTVTEALLAPGEYHIVAVACVRARTTLLLSEPQGNGLLRRSYASFSIAAGEVVNLGQISVVSAGRTAGVFNSFHNVTLEVGDWPLDELDRFKSQRPKLFAEMRVRLMTAHPTAALTPGVVEQKCAELKKLQAAGKVQTLPATCTGAAGKG